MIRRSRRLPKDSVVIILPREALVGIHAEMDPSSIADIRSAADYIESVCEVFEQNLSDLVRSLRETADMLEQP